MSAKTTDNVNSEQLPSEFVKEHQRTCYGVKTPSILRGEADMPDLYAVQEMKAPEGTIFHLKCSEPAMIVETPRRQESQLSLWLAQFSIINWLGLFMFIIPVCVGYVLVHYWLLQHDLVLYYASLYAQLGLLLMAWKQVH